MIIFLILSYHRIIHKWSFLWEIFQKIKTLAGEGKKAVTIAVYGNRAYEDALLEMNDILIQGGFTVIASAAFVAQHSIVPEVGAGRPDAEDIKEIRTFAEAVKSSTSAENVHVPGNRPYKPEMNVAAAPLSLPTCTSCGACAKICPTDAISKMDELLQAFHSSLSRSNKQRK